MLGVMTLAFATGIHAQNVTVEEPEFAGMFFYLTSDSTFQALPPEVGSFEKHKKGGVFSKIGKVAGLVGAAGGLGASIGLSGNNIGAAMTGFKVASAASQVGQAADIAHGISNFADKSGLDVVFRGKASSFVLPKGAKTVRILCPARDNDMNPFNIFRIFKLDASKKERRVQWMEFDMNSVDEKNPSPKDFVPFEACKYGKKSYIVTVPVEALTPGQYAIVYTAAEQNNMMPVSTFAVE